MQKKIIRTYTRKRVNGLLNTIETTDEKLYKNYKIIEKTKDYYLIELPKSNVELEKDIKHLQAQIINLLAPLKTNVNKIANSINNEIIPAINKNEKNIEIINKNNDILNV